MCSNTSVFRLHDLNTCEMCRTMPPSEQRKSSSRLPEILHFHLGFLPCISQIMDCTLYLTSSLFWDILMQAQKCNKCNSFKVLKWILKQLSKQFNNVIGEMHGLPFSFAHGSRFLEYHWNKHLSRYPREYEMW